MSTKEFEITSIFHLRQNPGKMYVRNFFRDSGIPGFLLWTIGMLTNDSLSWQRYSRVILSMMLLSYAQPSIHFHSVEHRKSSNIFIFKKLFFTSFFGNLGFKAFILKSIQFLKRMLNTVLSYFSSHANLFLYKSLHECYLVTKF